MRPHLPSRERARRVAALIALVITGIASLATTTTNVVHAELKGDWWVANGTPVSVPLVVSLSGVAHKSTIVSASLTEGDRISLLLRPAEPMTANEDGDMQDDQVTLPPCQLPPCDWNLSLDIGYQRLSVDETHVHWTIDAQLTPDDADTVPTLTIVAGRQEPSPSTDAVATVAVIAAVAAGVLLVFIGLSASALSLRRGPTRTWPSSRPARWTGRGRGESGTRGTRPRRRRWR